MYTYIYEQGTSDKENQKTQSLFDEFSYSFNT